MAAGSQRAGRGRWFWPPQQRADRRSPGNGPVMKTAAMLALLLAGAHGAAAQAPVTLEGRVAQPVATRVQALADSLARAGIPGQSLLRKALEGSAKGVPDERIVVAVRAVAGQLEQSAAALATARIGTDSQAIEAG